jgi:hypothetical protein
MRTLLDRTITLRTLAKYFLSLLVLLFLIYLYALVEQEFTLKYGGVSPYTSPIQDQIPEQCLGYSDVHSGKPYNYNEVDRLMLRGRVSRVSTEKLNNKFGCLGSAVLSGLHAGGAGDADFMHVYLDKTGKPIISISVEYHQKFNVLTIKESKK